MSSTWQYGVSIQGDIAERYGELVRGRILTPPNQADSAIEGSDGREPES
jgi:hypothetical protein